MASSSTNVIAFLLLAPRLNNIFLSLSCCILNSQNDSFYKVFVARKMVNRWWVYVLGAFIDLCGLNCWKCQFSNANIYPLICLCYWAYFISFINSFGSKMYLCKVYSHLQWSTSFDNLLQPAIIPEHLSCREPAMCSRLPDCPRASMSPVSNW